MGERLLTRGSDRQLAAGGENEGNATVITDIKRIDESGDDSEVQPRSSTDEIIAEEDFADILSTIDQLFDPDPLYEVEDSGQKVAA